MSDKKNVKQVLSDTEKHIVFEAIKKHGFINRVFNLKDFSTISVNVKFLRLWCRKIT